MQRDWKPEQQSFFMVCLANHIVAAKRMLASLVHDWSARSLHTASITVPRPRHTFPVARSYERIVLVACDGWRSRERLPGASCKITGGISVMLESNSTSHVFRFVSMRPPALVDASNLIPLSDDTFLVRTMIDSTRARRREVAQAYARDQAPKIDAFVDSDAAVALAKAIDKLETSGGTVSNLGTELRGQRQALEAHRDELSDYLLASKFGRAGEDAHQATMARLYRALYAWNSGALGKRKLAEVLMLPIVFPASLTGASASGKSVPMLPALPAAPGSAAVGTVASQPSPSIVGVQRVLSELAALHRSDFLTMPRDCDGAVAPPMVLNDTGMALLSQDAKDLLSSLNINPTVLPIYAVVTALETASDIRKKTVEVEGNAAPVTPHTPGVVGGSGVFPRIQTSGIADLLVLKQHLTGYLRADISHIENVMAGESRGTTFRNFERTEQSFTTEVEDTTEKQDELTTDQRFELKNETGKTINDDQKIGFGLTVSGKYGPAVEFNASSSLEMSTSSEESQKTAVSYAKDIVERSLERVTHRVRTEQVLRILREQEETSTHELTNQGPTHLVGLYQYLEKQYESQVFNYGLRQTFDFIVPEPASFSWWVEAGASTQPAVPTPPPRLDSYIGSAAEVNESNYLSTAAILGAADMSAPPPMYVMVTSAVKHGDTASNEEGQPRSIMEKDIPIPAGYVPFWARVMPTALTDAGLSLAITVGTAQRVWRPNATATAINLGNDFSVGSEGIGLSLSEMSFSQDVQSRLFTEVLAFESDAYTVVYNIIFVRTPEAYTAWQVKTYATLQAAWQNKQAKYEQDLEAAKLAANAQAQQASTLDMSPSQNAKIIRAELKKHCISILTQQRYEDFNSTRDTDPPLFDFQEAADQGTFVRFFEQAFEWDQLQYVFYPYFWGRGSTWAARYSRNDIDPDFLEYLQAGAARVVAPVRPGFERAVTHYLETGEIWNGEGAPPQINSPLYVSILDELKQRAEAPAGEIAVGDPWTTSVPTPLVILRAEAGLPRWERQNPVSWTWVESAPA